MDALGMVNALIGVVLVYFVLSLVVTAIVEWWQQVLGIRGEILAQSVASLYGEDSRSHGNPWRSAARLLRGTLRLLRVGPESDELLIARGPLTSHFFAHARIVALCETRGRPPSYIPDRTLAETLIESCLQVRTPQTRLVDLRAAPALLRKHLANLPDDATYGAVRRAFLDLFDGAAGDPERFIVAVEAWTREVHQRATGWLRRRITPIMFTVGLVVALIANADTVRLFQQLTADPELAEKIAAVAAREVTGRDYQGTVCAPTAKADSANGAQRVQASTSGENDTPSNPPPPTGSPAQRAENCESLLYAKRRALDVAPLLGWEGDPLALAYKVHVEQGGALTKALGVVAMFHERTGLALSKFAGLLITTFSLMLGAPFWFDALQKLVRVRASLRPAAGQSESTPTGAAAGESSAGTAASPGAAPHPSAPTPAPRVFNPLATGVDVGTAYWLSRAADAAYCTSEPAVREAVAGLFVYRAGRLDATLGNTQYAILERADAVILSFRGTESVPADWYTDVDAGHAPASWAPDVQVHRGFARALDTVWSEMLAQLRPLQDGRRRLWITGHSLGGALATLAAHRLLRADAGSVAGLCTFGQPRCGDPAFCTELESRLAGRYWRLVNYRDPVPRVPLAGMGYGHGGTLVYADSSGRLGIDPAWWLRGLDLLALPTAREQLALLVKSAVANHSDYTEILSAAPDARA